MGSWLLRVYALYVRPRCSESARAKAYIFSIWIAARLDICEQISSLFCYWLHILASSYTMEEPASSKMFDLLSKDISL